MGHEAAKQYLEMESSKDANEAHEHKKAFDERVKKRAKARTRKAKNKRLRK